MTQNCKENVYQFLTGYLNEACEVLQKASNTLPGVIEQIAKMIIDTIANNHKILICGNGGSAADAQHFAAELVVRFEMQRRAFPALALTTDTSLLTAVGNDLGFEEIFSRQVEALGLQGDILVAISTSGRSPNVLTAAKTARQLGLSVVALTGPLPNPLAQLSHVTLSAPSDQTAHTQIVHITAIHAICKLIERNFTGF